MAGMARALELFEPLEPRVVLSHSTLETALFYPEGFASARTEEVVTLQNSAGEATRFELHARYASGRPEGEVLASGTLAPAERRRIVVTPGGTLRGVLPRPFTPYALEVRADGEVGAVLTRTDFGATATEPFANGAAPQWSFPTVVRDAGAARDFITVYNPGEEAATVRLELLGPTGVASVVERVIEGERRGGFALNGIEGAPEGRLGARLTATEPVVAARSHFDLTNGRAVMNLGTPLLGQGSVTTGAFVETGLVDFDEAPTGQRTVGIVNPTAAAGVVDLTVLAGTGAAGEEPRALARSVLVRPGTRVEVSASELGLRAGEQIVSAAFSSTLPVAVGGEAFAATPALAPGVVGGASAPGVFPTPVAQAGIVPESGLIGAGGTSGAGFANGAGFGLGVSPALGFGGTPNGSFTAISLGGTRTLGGIGGASLPLANPLGVNGFGTSGLGAAGFGTNGFGTSGLSIGGGAGFGASAGLVGPVGSGAAAGSTIVGSGSLLGRSGGSLLTRNGASLLTRSDASPLSAALGTLPSTTITGPVATGGGLVTTGGTIAPAGNLLLRS